MSKPDEVAFWLREAAAFDECGELEEGERCRAIAMETRFAMGTKLNMEQRIIQKTMELLREREAVLFHVKQRTPYV